LLAALGAFFVLLKLIVDNDITRFGLYLGILAAVAVAAGAYLDLKESGVGMPTADDFRKLTGGGGDAPPPPPPPPG
jgi:hypothetical protein